MTFDRYDLTVREYKKKKTKKNRTNCIRWPISDTRIWKWMWATTANWWREKQSVKFKEVKNSRKPSQITEKTEYLPRPEQFPFQF